MEIARGQGPQGHVSVLPKRLSADPGAHRSTLTASHSSTPRERLQEALGTSSRWWLRRIYIPTVSERLWSALHAAGLDTIPALAGLEHLASVEDAAGDHLGTAVDEARARLGTSPVYLRRHVRALELLRADVEMDVDMNVEGGAYLWDARVTDRSGRGLVTEGYWPFVDWDPDATLAGPAAFAAFWSCSLRCSATATRPG